MTFFSYAQNYEDVVLWRALKDIDKGFYIDVGAQDPNTDSVTKAFYDAGWCGINIEPVSEFYEKLVQDRPHDINLQTAVGAKEGETEFYEVVGTGLSTTDQAIAEEHAQKYGYKIEAYKVPVTTLADICRKYSRPDIHILKIDVEGSEKPAILGMDLGKFRPWILVIESTVPNSPIQDFEDWEQIVLTADYEFVYFDGLNRYYVAKEHEEIGKALAIPPNVFDDFKRYSDYCLQNQLTETQAALTETQAQKELLEIAVRNSDKLIEAYPTAEFVRKDEQLRSMEAELQQAAAQLSESNLTISKLERDLEIATKELGSQVGNLKKQVASLETELSRNEMTRSRLNRQLQDVYGSKSWKITLPLRKLVDLMVLVRGFPRKLRIQLSQSIKYKMTSQAPEGAIRSRPPIQVNQDPGYVKPGKTGNVPSFLQDSLDVDEIFGSGAIERVASFIHKEEQI